MRGFLYEIFARNDAKQSTRSKVSINIPLEKIHENI